MLALDQVAMIIDSTATTGTDEVQLLGGAAPGYRDVSPVVAALGLTLPIGISYRIEDGSAWELGVGRITSDGYLERTTVTSSSASGARIDIVGDPDPAIMYIVACAISAPAVTPHFGAWSPALGAQVREGIEGGTALGSAARVDDYEGTAIGALARSRVVGASAIGARAQARVAGAVTTGEFNAGAVTWAGRVQTTDASPARAYNRLGHPFIPWTTGAYLIEAQVIGRRTSPSVAVYAATLTAVVYRIGAGSVPVLVGSVVKAVNGQSAGVTCDCDIEIDTELYEIAAGIEVEGGVAVMVSGASAETWQWSVAIRAVEQAG